MLVSKSPYLYEPKGPELRQESYDDAYRSIYAQPGEKIVSDWVQDPSEELSKFFDMAKTMSSEDLGVMVKMKLCDILHNAAKFESEKNV